MNALEVVVEATRRGAKLIPVGDRLRVDAPRGALSPELRRGLAEYKSQILSLLRAPDEAGPDDRGYGPQGGQGPGRDPYLDGQSGGRMDQHAIEDPWNEDDEHPRPRSQGRTGRRDHAEAPSGPPPEGRRYSDGDEPLRPYERSRDGDSWRPHEPEADGSGPGQVGVAGRPKAAIIASDFLDVNLVGNLVRWASRAKRRVGNERLVDLLELYLRSGNCSKELTEVIGYICNMVEEGPGLEADPTNEGVDLIHQLHGILTGGVPIAIKIPTKPDGGEQEHVE